MEILRDCGVGEKALRLIARVGRPVHHIVGLTEVNEYPVQRALLDEGKLLYELRFHDARPTAVPRPEPMETVVKIN